MKIKCFSQYSQHGFTLIELLLVVVLMGAIAGISINSFMDYNRHQKFSRVVTNFVNDLNTAKARTISQVKPNVNGCNNPGNILNGYSIDYKTNKYDLNVNCSGNPSKWTISTTDISSTGVLIRRLPSPPGSPNGTVYFKVLTGSVTGDTNLRIYNSFGSQKNITITSVGVITVSDP